MINHRCSICDKTDNEDVILDQEQFTDEPFMEDPKNPMFFICLSCYESIRDTLDDFEEKEDGEVEVLGRDT